MATLYMYVDFVSFNFFTFLNSRDYTTKLCDFPNIYLGNEQFWYARSMFTKFDVINGDQYFDKQVFFSYDYMTSPVLKKEM